ncbi:MAG: rhomboid family intramembrane serine protease [Bacteroidetes bacterium]|nr:rhomboid family intramembrane serine protease [Bacteroidota bacterium]
MNFNFQRRPQLTFDLKSPLVRLVIVNLAVFAFICLVQIYGKLMTDPTIFPSAISALSVPADLSALAAQPWTVLTYMFFHYNLLHILFNMLWFYWFGVIFLHFVGKRSLLPLYLLGGLVGALLYVVSFNAFPLFKDALPISSMLGASASVLAVVAAISTYKPDYSVNLMFLGAVKIKYIALVSVIIDLYSVDSDNAGGHFAHIGGALIGFLYGLSLRKGKNIFAKGGFKWKLRKRKPRMKVTYKRPETDEDYQIRKAEKQKKTDIILDKISQSGYQSLTKEEKEFLFQQSNNKK